jgi:hypothetical protein
VKLRNPFHGKDHAPGGADPTPTGPWHKVGDPGEYEQLLSGRNADPTALIPNPTPLQIRLAVGPPNIMDQDGTTILRYTKHQLEIECDLTDLNPGDLVTIVRPEYRQPTDKAVPGHDDNGNYVPCRLYKTGEFVYGVA